MLDQLAADLGHQDINLVIGRLSDHYLVLPTEAAKANWLAMREVQETFVAQHPRAALIDTDDLNDGESRKGEMYVNDLHYSAEGFRLLGQRFAEQSLALLNKINCILAPGARGILASGCLNCTK